VDSKTDRQAFRRFSSAAYLAGRIAVCATVLASMLALSGCYSKPLGVMASEDPSFKGMDMQLAEARLHNFLADHGTMSLALPDGDRCQGKWTISKKRFAGVPPESLLNAMGPLAKRNVSIVGNEPSSRNGKASLYCWRGTTVEVDFVTRRGTADGYGVARDSGGRYYLLDFGWP
jgi:hypothetical protein